MTKSLYLNFDEPEVNRKPNYLTVSRHQMQARHVWPAKKSVRKQHCDHMNGSCKCTSKQVDETHAKAQWIILIRVLGLICTNGVCVRPAHLHSAFSFSDFKKPFFFWCLCPSSSGRCRSLQLLDDWRGEPAGNYAKDLDSFKTGKQRQPNQNQNPNPKKNETRQPRKLPELLGVKKKQYRSPPEGNFQHT